MVRDDDSDRHLMLAVKLVKLVKHMSERTSSGRRLFLGDLDPSSSIIDLGEVPDSVWELLIETTGLSVLNTFSKSIWNVPFNLTLFDVGPMLSSSLTEPFHLPLTLVSYRGPVLSGMKLPPYLKHLGLIESTHSLQTSDVVLPPGLVTIVVQNPLKFSNLDSTTLPPSLESFQIIGKYNCSLEKMSFPTTLKILDVGQSKQPIDLLESWHPQTQIVSKNSSLTKDMSKLDESSLTIDMSNEESRSVIDQLRQHVSSTRTPRLNEIHVSLDHDTSLGDVWTDVLFEGRVQVRQLTITNTNPENSCMGDCGEVFHRSRKLRRKLCRKLVVISETYKHSAHLNLASSLKNVGGISLEISYNTKPSECLLPRFASILGLSKQLDHSYVSDSFGAISTSVHISSEGKLIVNVGDSPLPYEPPRPPQPLTVAVSSSALREVSNVEVSKPRDKPIILYTWKSCGFCQKQATIIEEFTKVNDNNKNTFYDKVNVVALENPGDVPDKRIDSFPTWVKNDNLIVGVQDAEKLKTLLL